MPPKKPLTKTQKLQQLIDAASTLTQAQIDACGYAMCANGWTRESIIEELKNSQKFWESHSEL